jgi:uncharacterized protein (DUF427 family)
MTLTKAPQTKAGPLLFEPSPRWVCATVRDITVADSKRVLLLWEEDKVISVYLFPREDVRTDLLSPSENPLPEAHHGLASYWTLELDGQALENAAWAYTAAPPPERAACGLCSVRMESDGCLVRGRGAGHRAPA